AGAVAGLGGGAGEAIEFGAEGAGEIAHGAGGSGGVVLGGGEEDAEPGLGDGGEDLLGARDVVDGLAEALSADDGLRDGSALLDDGLFHLVGDAGGAPDHPAQDEHLEAEIVGWLL